MRVLIVLSLCLIISGTHWAEKAPLFEYLKQKKAIQSYKQGDLEKALERNLEILKKDPQNAPAQQHLGLIYAQQGHYDRAIQAFEKAKKGLDKHYHADVDYGLGNVAYQKGDFEKAIKHYTESLRLDPSHDDVKINMELARKKLENQTEKADEAEEEEEEQEEEVEQEEEEEEQEEEEEPEEEQEEDPLDDLENLLNSIDQMEQEARSQFLNKDIENQPNVENDW